MKPDPARAALIARQGGGARYDAATAPARELAWARAGTAYFARLLNGLDDASLAGPSANAGWSRRAIIAQHGYQTRRMGQFIGAAQQQKHPGTVAIALAVTPAEISLGTTLPARALRHLIDHTTVHLNVAWRDLSDADWGGVWHDQTGRQITMRDTPLIRARAIWQNALALDAGGRLRDLPDGLTLPL